jgi:hypothetical protein
MGSLTSYQPLGLFIFKVPRFTFNIKDKEEGKKRYAQL